MNTDKKLRDLRFETFQNNKRRLQEVLESVNTMGVQEGSGALNTKQRNAMERVAKTIQKSIAVYDRAYTDTMMFQS